MVWVVFGASFIVLFFGMYKLHQLVREITELVEVHEVIVVKIDKIAACLDALPYEFKKKEKDEKDTAS